MMKRKLLSLALILLVVFSLCSCAFSGNASDVSLNVYNWGEYIDLSVLDDFEEQTGIKVNYTTFASNEEMYSKIVSGAASYDVIIPSEYMISKMIDEDLLAELNFDNIPNYQYIGEEYKGLDYDPNNLYSVPYTWGTVVIVYNTEYVDEEDVEDESIELLWNEKYSGKILMFDNPRDSFALAHSKLGNSMNTTDPAAWEAAAEELIRQKPLVQAYVMDQVFDKMISEEAYIAPYYAGDALTMMDENENLAAYVPVEGANRFFDSMCVLKNSRHKDEAEAFINFMCDTEIALRNAEEVCYAIPQIESFELLDEETKEDTMVYPPEEVLEKCEVFVNLPAETLKLQSELWIELKTHYK
ncbi:MAG: ABC transporter substrate-binding protein [Oscillospiraceae bacterium]|nr:ABC transporter substrate-binding protein [Oscillospiraceae bacterium]